MSITPGAIRFNTDSMKLEYYRGGPVGFGTTTTTGEWVQITTDSPDVQTGGTRVVVGGGYTPSGQLNNIDYFNADTTGNTIDFGTFSSSRRNAAKISSSTRGVFAGGYRQDMEFVTISSTGGGTVFGNLSVSKQHQGGISNSTRGISVSGYVPSPAGGSNVMEYITIAATGNAVDFGDLTTGADYFVGGTGNSTRGLTGGGAVSGHYGTIDFITISTLGNSADFGNLTTHTGGANPSRRLDGDSCHANAVRAIFGGGYSSTTAQETVIDYMTIATLGDAIDFGDLSTDGTYSTASGSRTRAVFMGGSSPYRNVMEYVQIMTTGNAVDFGDMDVTAMQRTAVSNGHGGLG
jgi:hypothetical protein